MLTLAGHWPHYTWLCKLKLYIRRLSVTNLSSENNLPTFSTECSSRHQTFALMTTGPFSRNVGKLFSELKLVTDNLLSMQQPAEKSLKVYIRTPVMCT